VIDASKEFRIFHNKEDTTYFTFMLPCIVIQGGSNMTGTDLYVNKPHYAAAVRP